jgi:predicted transcriptional regulator
VVVGVPFQLIIEEFYAGKIYSGIDHITLMVSRIRTTVSLRLDQYEKLRLYMASAGRVVTMQEIVELLIDRFLIENERKMNGRAMEESIEENEFAQSILSVLEIPLSDTTARAVLVKSCANHDIDIEELSPETVTPQLLTRICKNLNLLLSRRDCEKIEVALASIVKATSCADRTATGEGGKSKAGNRKA